MVRLEPDNVSMKGAGSLDESSEVEATAQVMSVAEAQEIDDSTNSNSSAVSVQESPDGSGMALDVQVVPDSTSMKPPDPSNPVAAQVVDDEHETVAMKTPVSAERAWAAVQLEPDSVSMRP